MPNGLSGPHPGKELEINTITPVIPQEIYLLERYSSLVYFGRMRDAFEACVKAAENALAEFMRHLPLDYRTQPQFKQPEIVWGERVIPILQWALRGLNDGYIQLSHGEADALGMSDNVNTSFTAITRDYDCEWMLEPFYAEFNAQQSLAWEMASNISHTQQGNWKIHSLAKRYSEDNRGPLDAPDCWPIYRLNPATRVKTGNQVPQNGVYLPDVPNSCAEFLIKGYEAWEANVQNTPDDLDESGYFRSPTVRQPTAWTLIERVADSGGGIPGDPATAGIAPEARRPNIPANHPCPEAGWWYTPAQTSSRRYFKQGESMPSVGKDYGKTFWQWSPDQAAPKL